MTNIYEHCVWLNPVPERALGLHAIDRHDPRHDRTAACIPLTLAGLDSAMRELMR